MIFLTHAHYILHQYEGGWPCIGVTIISPTLPVITSTLATTDSSVNSVYNPIIVANDHAQAYVATDGREYHTAKLESAFRCVKKFPNHHLTDMEVARVIVNYNARQQH